MNYFNFCLLGNFFTSPSILMDKFAFWIIPVWQFLFFECYEYITLLPSGLQVLVAQSCLILCDPMDCSLSGSSVHGDSPGKNTGVGCHFLLQRIFLTQESNPGLLHCRQILYRLSYKGSPLVSIQFSSLQMFSYAQY